MKKTARIEVRSVAPDTNPYLWLYTLIKTGMTGENCRKIKTRAG